MRSISIITLLLVSCCLSAGCESGPKEYTIDQFMDYTWLAGGDFSRDESQLLVTTDRSGLFNAFSIPITGGEMKQLTNSTEKAVFALSWMPASDSFLFLSVVGREGDYHIFLADGRGGQKDLTPWPRSRSVFHGFTRDLEKMVITSNKRDRRFEDVYLIDTRTLKPKMIYLNDAGYNFGSISGDARYIALDKYLSEHDSRMLIYDRETGALEDVSDHSGDVIFEPIEFDPSSKYLYYLTDLDSEFRYLRRYELATGESETVETAPWDIIFSAFSRDGEYRVTGINAGGKTEIRLYDTASGTPLKLYGMPEGEISMPKFSRSGRYLRFFVSGSTMPRDLYVYDFQKDKALRVTRSMHADLDPGDLVEAESIEYESFDGEKIPAVLFKPKGLSQGSSAPALIYVHGGPGGQMKFGYHGFFQYLVNHGYVVIAPNNRGSSGYGKRFQSLDDRRHGRDDMRDLIAGKRWLEKTGYVDPEKVGIIGTSYGGFLVLSSMIAHPDEFAAGVDLFGMVDWGRTLQDLPAYWEHYKDAFYREMGYPDKDAEYLRSISPLYSAERISRPLMVVQGGMDTWVLRVEAEEVVDKARGGGNEVEYLLFEEEGHGIDKRSNLMKAYRDILGFLDRHLKDPH